MPRARVLISALLGLVSIGRAQTSELQGLYKAHKWVELNQRLQHAQDGALYRGAFGLRSTKILSARNDYSCPLSMLLHIRLMPTMLLTGSAIFIFIVASIGV